MGLLAAPAAAAVAAAGAIGLHSIVIRLMWNAFGH